MTLYQIEEIMAHERTEQGTLLVDDDLSSLVTEQEKIFARYRAMGLTEAEANHKFNEEYCVIAGFRDGLEKRGMSPEEIERRVAEFRRGVVKKRKWGR